MKNNFHLDGKSFSYTYTIPRNFIPNQFSLSLSDSEKNK